jgi:hypothetical protein
MPLKSGSLVHLQAAYAEVFNGLGQALAGGDYDPTKAFILFGCVNSGSGLNYDISAGAVFFDGEIYLVPAAAFTAPGGQVAVGLITVNYFTDPTADAVTFTDGDPENVHQILTMNLMAGLSGSGTADFSAWETLNLNIPQFNLTAGTNTTVSGTYPNQQVNVPNQNPIRMNSRFPTSGAGMNPGVDGTVIDGSVASIYTVALPTATTLPYRVRGTLVSASGTSSGQESDTAVNWTLIDASRTTTQFQICLKKKDNASGATNLYFEYDIL